MPPSGEFLRLITPAAAMVDGFVETTLNTNKTKLLPSNYGTFWLLVVCENLNPKTDPILSSLMRQASFKCEPPGLELKSSRSFLAIKRCQGTTSKKVIKLARSSLKKVAHVCSNRGIPVNSLTPKFILVETKNSLSEDFWLAKHKDTHIPTMIERFSSPAAWFWWTSVPHPQEPMRKGLDEAVIEGFNIKL